MEVILTQDVVKLGNRGEVVRVKDGYARNFLIPRKLALPATESNKRHFAEVVRQTRARVEKERTSAEELREKLDGEHVKITLSFGETGKAYGSVTAKDIASSFREKGIFFDHHQIILDYPLKEAGAYDVQVRIFEGVTATVKVWIVPEGQPEEAEKAEVVEDSSLDDDESEETPTEEAPPDQAVEEVGVEVNEEGEEIAEQTQNTEEEKEV
ncbi:50S ribosomal protein L9 [candidate division WOR-3 bacterium]|nr:50S ribosomal protein L9 [candidate division WOR-3 bacterium]